MRFRVVMLGHVEADNLEEAQAYVKQGGMSEEDVEETLVAEAEEKRIEPFKDAGDAF